MENAIGLIFQVGILIFSVVIHEVAHGFAALMLGDHTAEEEGRLTLNPVPHIDPFGSVILPAMSYLFGGIIVGWAKPVPYNPYRLRNRAWGPALVGTAGPAANIFIAAAFGVIVRFSPFASDIGFLGNLSAIAGMIALLNLTLAIFNLVPIPPLDGSKVLFAVLPSRWRGAQTFLERYGVILLILFIGFFSHLLLPVIAFAFRLLTGATAFF